MAHSLNDIARSRFALRPYHRRTLVDSAQRLSKIPRTADERDSELRFVDMIPVVSRRKDLALVNIVDLDRFKDLSLGEVTDPAFCHYRDRNRSLDAFYHLRVAHS